MGISREDWETWRHGVIGRWFFDQQMGAVIRGYEIQLGAGLARKTTAAETAASYAEMVGLITGVREVIEFNPEEFTDEG